MTATSQPNLPLRLAAMASDDKQFPHTLMTLPLEVRHNIFDHVAVREAEPKKLLRYWFEKKEVKTIVAAQDPKASSPRIVYAGDDFESEESEEFDESDSDEGSDYDSDEAEEDDSEGDEDSDIVDAEGESDDEDLDEEEVDLQDALMAQVAQNNTSLASSSAQGNAPAQSQPQISAAPTQLTGVSAAAQTPATHDQEEIGNGDTDADMDEDDEDFHDAQNGTEEDTRMDVDSDNEDGHEEAQVDSDEEMIEDEDDEDTTVAAPVPVVKAHRKWRHIPKVSIKDLKDCQCLLRRPLYTNSNQESIRFVTNILLSLVPAHYALPTTCGTTSCLEGAQRSSKELVLRCGRAPHQCYRQLRSHQLLRGSI
jgi:hypothetical protein